MFDFTLHYPTWSLREGVRGLPVELGKRQLSFPLEFMFKTPQSLSVCITLCTLCNFVQFYAVFDRFLSLHFCLLRTYEKIVCLLYGIFA